MKHVAFALSTIVLLAGCAQQPENIAAAEIRGDPYRGYSCRQLAAEELQINQALDAASADQRRAASSDAFGVFLIGLPISSMSGNDRESDIAIARGHLNLINQRQTRLGC